MTDPLERRIIEIIQDTLHKQGKEQNVLIRADDSMETVTAWDSLSFMTVFLAINEAFGVNPEFDDAIHYTSVKSLYDYLKGQLA
jgi:acyl carrier protein